MSELAPPREGASPERVEASTAARVAAVALAAAAAFWWIFLCGSPNAYDWASHHYHYFDWVRIAFTEHHSVPLYMADAWVTPNFLANAESPTLSPLAPLLLLLPTGAYLDLLVVVYCAAGLAGMYGLLRDLGAALPAALLGALVFAFGGFPVSHVAVGHHWAMGAWLLPALFALFRRAALGSGPALCAAAALDAATILAGQHQPFLWQNGLVAGFAALWALRVRALFPLRTLAWLALLTAGLGAAKLVPMALEFADYAPTQRIVGLPPAAALVSVFVRGQHPELPAPGFAYEHGAGWWEYAFYVGPLAGALLAAGAVSARGCRPLLVLAAVCALLALQWPAAVDPWRWLQELPGWRTQRGPSRLLFPALFCLTVAGALGLSRIWERERARHPRAALVLGVAFVALVAADLWNQSRPWQRAAAGEPLASRDHRPRPLRFGPVGKARAELVRFEPNRLVYRVQVRERASLVFPVRYGKRGAEWEVDGLPALSRDGKLLLELPPGERDVVMTYRPGGRGAGLAISGLTLGLLAAAAWRRRRGTGA